MKVSRLMVLPLLLGLSALTVACDTAEEPGINEPLEGEQLETEPVPGAPVEGEEVEEPE
ncbi:hypothetical protein IQ273_05945 [Nodosilinea sp. LEGE 07298]|uniref:hypothetical protein n=1 Tax=Nodosilinea sp. LEGE 07298 TaxID=2777970 RepID=UPI0018803226|nr:hypothetical protein [Nodosilinea sp. LEGE 07298]MBE9108957.1 hypothetical protein [Nodosilinea sp. LEGE 07298]